MEAEIMTTVHKVSDRVNALEDRVSALEAERVTRTPDDPVTPDDREDRVATPVADAVPLIKRSGLFHVPEPGREVWRAGLRAGVKGKLWRRIRVSLTVEITEWHADEPDGLHGIFWLYRDGRWRGNTIGYVNARGPDRNKLTVLNNIGLSKGETRRKAPRWIPDSSPNRVTYEYHTGWDQASLWMGDVLGDMLMHEPLSAPGPLAIKESLHLEIGLHEGIIEVPTYGWRYSDLLVEGWRA